MKKVHFFVFLIFTLAQYNMHSQEVRKPKRYITKVKTLQKGQKQVGYLAELNETSIMLMEKYTLTPLPEINVDQIKKVNFRRKGSVLKGAAIGTAVGFLGGMLIFSGDECKNHGGSSIFGQSIGLGCEQMGTLEGGAFMAQLGAITGALIGTCKKRIMINGSQERYEKKKEKMRQFLY